MRELNFEKKCLVTGERNGLAVAATLSCPYGEAMTGFCAAVIVATLRVGIPIG